MSSAKNYRDFEECTDIKLRTRDFEECTDITLRTIGTLRNVQILS